MPVRTIEICQNTYRKSLPDVAAADDDTFFVVWAAAPDEESPTADFAIVCQKVSSTGALIGEPIEIVKTTDILMLPRIVYDPHSHRSLVIYCIGEEYFNIRGIFLEGTGKPVSPPFKVTDVPANQFHYTMALNTRRNQFLVVYNDFRDNISTVYGVIIDSAGTIVKPEFPLCTAPGHQVNPVACYNPDNDTYLINWEDFRAHDNQLDALATLEVMTDIYGALLSGDGQILVGDIPLCADASDRNADQRFNGIAYNTRRKEFLTSWTDTRDSLHNVGIVGRIAKPDGSMLDGDFVMVDAAGAQMISHTIYVPEEDSYLVACERDYNDVDPFYFKDIKAHVSIAAQWLDGSGRPQGNLIDIYRSSTNQRFVRLAHHCQSNAFLFVWQSDFPGVSDSVEGHIMSAGGDIWGALYKKD